jgi:hypothetical protein
VSRPVRHHAVNHSCVRQIHEAIHPGDVESPDEESRGEVSRGGGGNHGGGNHGGGNHGEGSGNVCEEGFSYHSFPGVHVPCPSFAMSSCLNETSIACQR